MGEYLHPDAPPDLPDVVALFSGGVDSYCMSYLCQPDVLLSVDMGGRYGQAEAQHIVEPPGLEGRLIRLECKAIGGFEDAVTAIVPGRNAFLAMFGAFLGSTILLASVHEEAHVGGCDKDEGFTKALAGLWDHMLQPQRWLPQGRTVRMLLPVHHLTKAQLVGYTLAAGHPPDLLAHNTFSCYTPIRRRGTNTIEGYGEGWHACGQCGACARKWAAFAVWGVDVGFPKPPALEGYVQEAKALVRSARQRQDARTAQWVLDQLDADTGRVRQLEETRLYPALGASRQHGPPDYCRVADACGGF